MRGYLPTISEFVDISGNMVASIIYACLSYANLDGAPLDSSAAELERFGILKIAPAPVCGKTTIPTGTQAPLLKRPAMPILAEDSIRDGELPVIFKDDARCLPHTVAHLTPSQAVYLRGATCEKQGPFLFRGFSRYSYYAPIGKFSDIDCGGYPILGVVRVFGLSVGSPPHVCTR